MKGGGRNDACTVTKVSVYLQAQEQGRPPEQISRFYVKGAMQYLVPILLMTLAKQVTISHTLSSAIRPPDSHDGHMTTGGV